MVLHKEQERIYRELMEKVGSARSPASHELTHHDEEDPHSLHGDREALNREKEQTIKTLIARTVELEQLNNALLAKKARAETAEQETRAVLQEKDRSVQDLEQRLHDITEKAEQQRQEIQRLADELAAEQSLLTEAEHQLEVFRQEIGQRETALVAEKESMGEHRYALQQKLDALTASFDAERQKSASLESEIRSLNEALKQQRAKDEELQELHSVHGRLREELDAQKTALAMVLGEQEPEKSSRKNLGEELAAAVLGLAESEKQARAITCMQDQLREKLGNKNGSQKSPGTPAPIHRDRSELDRALKLHKDEELICRETGDKDGLQKSLGNQAVILRDLGELDSAMKLHKEEERICRETGNKDGLQRSLGNQAVVLRDRGELDNAMKLHKEKEQICREIGNKKGIIISLVNQAGILVYERQDPAAALPILEEAYQIAVSSGFEKLVEQLRIHLEKVRKMNREPSRLISRIKP
ncbi:MAG: hypothetical protein PHT99_02510 [Methanoregula sp.]|nr:hypothetical protein [Methanoregula sp.]